MGALKEGFVRRRARVRHTLKRRRTAARGCRCSAPRKHIYAQVIDDAAGARWPPPRRSTRI